MTVEEARQLRPYQRTRARARGEDVPFLPRWRGGRRRLGSIPHPPRKSPSPCLVRARTGALCSYCRVKSALYLNAVHLLDGTRHVLTQHERELAWAARRRSAA